MSMVEHLIRALATGAIAGVITVILALPLLALGDWLAAQERIAPNRRNQIAHALLVAWEGMKHGLEWAFTKIGIVSR
ncbi:hypothetical protein [Nocardiopsis dassonvillei]|uniref:hypothetical protein n=1 Tax=Nocardiopsis dassonvillei TaxID=2014 RepID=UPI00157CA931|nr:hypothetical protein [Nocardiopsis dassonvillei]